MTGGDRGDWPAGTFLVRVRAGTVDRAQTQAKALGLTVAGVGSEPAHGDALTVPRAGSYHGFGGNSDEGWTRYMLEQSKLPFDSVHDDVIRTGDLRSKYDVTHMR